MTLQYEEMPENRMNELLLELGQTETFNAIMTYIFSRDKLTTAALRSIDPFKNPTEMARNQGISMGLFDLRDHIFLLEKNIREVEGSDTSNSEKKG